MRVSQARKSTKPDESTVLHIADAKPDGKNKLVVPVYSGFFSSLENNVMCTNAAYDELRDEIDASIQPYSTKKDIVLAVYESSDADSDVRESVLMGFERYIAHYKKRESFELKLHFSLFLSLFIIGVLIEFLLYETFADMIVDWIVNTLDIFAWVFIWQFAEYLAFDFAKEIKNVNRLKQILRIEYVFKRWE